MLISMLTSVEPIVLMCFCHRRLWSSIY